MESFDGCFICKHRATAFCWDTVLLRGWRASVCPRCRGVAGRRGPPRHAVGGEVRPGTGGRTAVLRRGLAMLGWAAREGHSAEILPPGQ
ncbi:unnamed protein product [Gadus morhua 'NCC']